MILIRDCYNEIIEEQSSQCSSRSNKDDKEP